MSARRIIAFVAALIVACAPVALEACEAACALHETSAAVTHSCHDMAEATDGPVLTSGPHPCGHTTDLPAAASGDEPVVVTAPAVLPVVAQLTPPVVHAGSTARASDARPSVPIPIDTPLRV